jgi:hypothetical protein
VAALGVVTVILVRGAGLVKNTAREQGSLMITVKEAIAVLPSTTAVKVIRFELTFESVALLIETTPLTSPAFSVFVTKVKDGFKDQVGF